MPILKHTHIMRRLSGTANAPMGSIFICDDPHCTYKELAVVLKDKASICAKCKKTEIILDYNQLRLARPRCPECADSEENLKKKKLEESMKEIFK